MGIPTSERPPLANNEHFTSTKEGGVSKIKTEVITSMSAVKKTQSLNNPERYIKSFKLNQMKQVRKVVHKNNSVAPISTTYHRNDVVMKYSPAVCKEAIIRTTEDMTEGKVYNTENLEIKVIKTRLSKDTSGVSKVDNLITLNIRLKNKPEINVKQKSIFTTHHNL